MFFFFFNRSHGSFWYLSVEFKYNKDKKPVECDAEESASLQFNKDGHSTWSVSLFSYNLFSWKGFWDVVYGTLMHNEITRQVLLTHNFRQRISTEALYASQILYYNHQEESDGRIVAVFSDVVEAFIRSQMLEISLQNYIMYSMWL